MARGEPSHRGQDRLATPAVGPGHNGSDGLASGFPEPNGGPPRQREILAQFEAAIAGMRTREIQIGLRRLLGGAAPPPRALAGAATARPGAAESSGKVPLGQDETGGADGGNGTADAPGHEPDASPRPVAELIRAIRTASAQAQMEQLVSDAQLERWVQIDTEAAARMVHPYAWLLHRVGDDGIRLTEAGHLPPAQVEAARRELGIAADKPVRRENQVLPVRQLRESAQAMGLLRKQRGQLLLTALGSDLRACPAALWWHLAERVPLRAAASRDVQPGLILLVCVAARCTDTLDVTIARMLTSLGWVNSDGSPLTGAEAARATCSTHAALRCLGALADDPCPGRSPRPTPEGVAFARAALRTWPV